MIKHSFEKYDKLKGAAKRA